jgi:hypothetical protein
MQAEEIDIIDDIKKPIEEVLSQVQEEKPYTDLLEYLSVTGIFNLTDSSKYQEWGQLQ